MKHLLKKIEEWFSKAPKNGCLIFYGYFQFKAYSKALELGYSRKMQSVMKDNDICGDFNFDEFTKRIEKMINSNIIYKWVISFQSQLLCRAMSQNFG